MTIPNDIHRFTEINPCTQVLATAFDQIRGHPQAGTAESLDTSEVVKLSRKMCQHKSVGINDNYRNKQFKNIYMNKI